MAAFVAAKASSAAINATIGDLSSEADRAYSRHSSSHRCPGFGWSMTRPPASIVAVLDPRRPGSLSRSGTPPVGIPSDRSNVPLVGVMIGPGGTLLSTNGGDVSLPIGAVLRIRTDRPIEIK